MNLVLISPTLFAPEETGHPGMPCYVDRTNPETVVILPTGDVTFKINCGSVNVNDYFISQEDTSSIDSTDLTATVNSEDLINSSEKDKRLSPIEKLALLSNDVVPNKDLKVYKPIKDKSTYSTNGNLQNKKYSRFIAVGTCSGRFLSNALSTKQNTGQPSTEEYCQQEYRLFHQIGFLEYHNVCISSEELEKSWTVITTPKIINIYLDNKRDVSRLVKMIYNKNSVYNRDPKTTFFTH